MMKTLITQAIAGKSSEIGHALQQHGWWAGQLLPLECTEALLADANGLHNGQHFQQAAVGSSHTRVISNAIRGDETCWVEGNSPAQRIFLEGMEELKAVFESYFPIRLNNFEGHYSYYPARTFYRKHMDNARQSNNRIFSAVTYLNPAWQEGDGGELALFNPETEKELALIQPDFGTTVIFFSADFPHEVRETMKPRYSLTGWFHQSHDTL